MQGDGFVERPPLVGQISKVRVLAGDCFLAAIPAAHAGVQCLPAAQTLHLHVSPIAVNTIASLVQEICIILSTEGESEIKREEIGLYDKLSLARTTRSASLL